MMYVITTGDETHGWSVRGATVNPDKVIGLVIEADDLYRKQYGGQPHPMTMQATELPVLGKTSLPLPNVRVTAVAPDKVF